MDTNIYLIFYSNLIQLLYQEHKKMLCDTKNQNVILFSKKFSQNNSLVSIKFLMNEEVAYVSSADGK